jgi:hypothetical protein
MLISVVYLYSDNNNIKTNIMNFTFNAYKNGTNRETSKVETKNFTISITGEIGKNDYTVWREEKGVSIKLMNPKGCNYTKERAILKAESLLKIAKQAV